MIGTLRNTIIAILVASTALTATAQLRYSATKAHSTAARINHRITVAKDTTESAFEGQCADITAQYTDSLNALRVRFDSISHATDINAFNNLLVNPYYYRLFVNPMLYRSALKQAMQRSDGRNDRIMSTSGFAADMPHKTQLSGATNESARLATTGLSPLDLNHDINNFFLGVYTQHPEIVHLTDDDLERQGSLRTDIDKKLDYKTTVSDKIKPQEVENVVEPVIALSRKPNFWKFNGNMSLQLMQNYVNDKWYQGGTPNNSMNFTSWFTANYNNQQKVQWDNKLEMNIGFQTDRNDTYHSFKTNTDLLRMTNKIGLRAIGNWYYTVSLQSWTQFYRKYNGNSDYIYSDFMSPFESVLSVGMDYKLNKKKYNLTVVLAPLSYDFIYVGRHDLTSRYGVPGRHHSYEKIGSNITCNFNWTICKELSWSTRFYTFTNYKSVVSEWENTFNFVINKFLSTKVYLYPRFDDAFNKGNKYRSNAKLQFKEYMSMSLNWGF